MSFVKNKKPLEVWMVSNSLFRFRWKKHHAKECASNCPCCVKDWDCTCGAITWERKKPK